MDMLTKSWREHVGDTWDNGPELQFSDRSFVVAYAGRTAVFVLGHKVSPKRVAKECNALKRSNSCIAGYFSHFTARVIDPETHKPRAFLSFKEIALEELPLLSELTWDSIEHAMLISRLRHWQEKIEFYEGYFNRYAKRGRSPSRTLKLRLDNAYCEMWRVAYELGEEVPVPGGMV